MTTLYCGLTAYARTLVFGLFQVFRDLMWEHGGDQEPVEFLDDRGIIK
jgi:hypothetical protein